MFSAAPSRQVSEFSDKLVSVKEYGYCEDPNPNGNRDHMEDQHFAFDNIVGDGHSGLFAILDGHGGADAVTYCTKHVPLLFTQQYKQDANVEHLFTDIFKEVDKELKANTQAELQGSTIGAVFVRKEGDTKMLYSINLGDTRVVLATKSGHLRLSEDDKAYQNKSEQARVKEEGGIIFGGRVGGTLAITRALGDLELKQDGVSNVPHVNAVKLDGTEEFVIIASDGLWDVVEDQDAVEYVRKGKNAQEMAQSLLKHGLDKRTLDNISVMVIKLH